MKFRDAAKTAVLSTLLTLAATANSAAVSLPACPDGVCGGLGNAFPLPTTNDLAPLTGGKVFFKNRQLETCVKYTEAKGSDHREFQEKTSTWNLLDSLATSASLSGSYDSHKLTFGATTSATTGYDISKSGSIHSLTLDILFVSGYLDFRQDATCWTSDNIDPEFLAAFEALPEVADPSASASWVPYTSFLSTRGSHIMVQETLGSRFQQWESLESSSTVTKQTLEAAACADVEGKVGTDGWSAQGCADYSSEERKAADDANAQARSNTLGGTIPTRKELLKGVTAARLDAFIDAANKADQEVAHQWEPIWDLLAKLYQTSCKAGVPGSCDNYQRALNLQAAYEGWLAVGCELDEARDRPIQIMQIASKDPKTGVKTYGCWAKKEGCSGENADCHVGGLGSVCYCYGEGCIVRDTSAPIGDPTAPAGYRNKRQSKQDNKSYDKGVNNSCYYEGAKCWCSSGKVVAEDDRYLWRQ